MFSRTQRAPAMQVPQVGEKRTSRRVLPRSASKSERSWSTLSRLWTPPAPAVVAGAVASSPPPQPARPSATKRSSAALGADIGRGAVERVERGADRHALADEDRRVALRVPRGLALAQRQHQVHEVGRLLALERRHELLVVDPERVGGVVV